MRRAAVIVIFFATVTAIWWLAVASGRWSAVLLPSPVEIARYLWSAALDGTILHATLVTMKRLLIGYAIGVAVGLPLGLLMSSNQWVEDTIGALALGFQTL